MVLVSYLNAFRWASRRRAGGLIGPNGAGKSTFLKLLLGQRRQIQAPSHFVSWLASVMCRKIRLPFRKNCGPVLQEALISLPLDEAQKEGRLAVSAGQDEVANA
jgi:ABC-type molybdenum transport system ATPase subunit/photorepair protein PhrA